MVTSITRRSLLHFNSHFSDTVLIIPGLPDRTIVLAEVNSCIEIIYQVPHDILLKKANLDQLNKSLTHLHTEIKSDAHHIDSLKLLVCRKTDRAYETYVKNIQYLTVRKMAMMTLPRAKPKNCIPSQTQRSGL